MIVYIDLGSNIGDRKLNLLKAFEEISKISANSPEISSLYESPALLPEFYGDDWNCPFLNAAVKIEFEGSCQKLLKALQAIEEKLGKANRGRQKWAPRTIDLDILIFGDEIIKQDHLVVPHSEISRRPFVLAPLRDLCPDMILPDSDQKSILSLNRNITNPLPLWMHIVNITPDSFSDGGNISGTKDFLSVLDNLDDDYISIVDIGAESTRPHAEEIDTDREWKRLEPYLEIFKKRYAADIFQPLLSVDTRNPATARRSIAMGANIINDVSGFSCIEMLEVLEESSCNYVLMHSLSIPADPKITLLPEHDVLEEMSNWLEKKLEFFEKHKIDLKRIIFDPGIGFGKTSNQSLEILKRIDQFHSYPVKIAVGHSRKSFMASFSPPNPSDRDYESIGLSIELSKKGVDILRVHNASLHKRTYMGQGHLN